LAISSSEIFRFEKVEINPTFSQRKFRRSFARKIITKPSAHAKTSLSISQRIRGEIATKLFRKSCLVEIKKIISLRNRFEINKLLLINQIYCALIGYQ
jgi:hypothetical protein